MVQKRFYRVQSDRSFTEHDASGFTAKGSYWMHYSHWLNKGKIERHLKWQDRSHQPTPFISVFDNLGDAQDRAAMLRERNHHGVFVAEILLPDPQQSTLEVGFSDKHVNLPVVLHRDDNGTTTFLSTPNAREHLEVSISVSQRTEWFALEHIPNNIITRAWRY